MDPSYYGLHTLKPKKYLIDPIKRQGQDIVGSFFENFKKGTASLMRASGYHRAIIQLSTSQESKKFYALMRLLATISPNKFRKFQDTITDCESIRLLPEISYRGRIDSTNSFVVETVPVVEKDYVAVYGVIMEFFGRDRWKHREKVLREIEKLEEIPGKIGFLTNRMQCIYTTTRSFDQVFLAPGVKERIIKGLYRWHMDRDWYHAHNLVHKLGILLYGPPGTGKSSIIRSIASTFPAPVVVNISGIAGTDISDTVAAHVSKRKSVMIVILEDIDKILEANTMARATMYGSAGPASDVVIMQMLDGFYSFEDTIYIATTNHYEKLSPEFTRYGRFDIQEKLEYFDEELALKFLKSFGLGKEFLDSHKDELQAPYQPAHLQALIMRDR